jgi:hypothetical protein
MDDDYAASESDVEAKRGIEAAKRGVTVSASPELRPSPGVELTLCANADIGALLGWRERR